MTVSEAAVASNAPITNTEVKEERGPRRPNPMNQEFDRKKAIIEDRIASLQRRLESLKNGGSDDSSSSNKSERSRVIGELKETREKMRAARESATTEMKALKEVQAQLKKQKDDVREQKDKLPFKSIGEIDARISQLESKIETGSFSLTEEKQVLQDISKLKKTKKTLELLEAGITSSSDASTNLKVKEELLRNRMTGKFAEVDELKAKVEGLERELDVLDGGKEEAAKKQKARLNEMEKLKKQIDAEYDSRRKLIDEHRDAKQKQREAWERNQARRAEEDKKRKIEDDIWELERKLESLNPASAIDKKIDECVNLTNYFSSLSVGNADDSRQGTDSAPKVDLGEFVALTPKDKREQVFIAGSSGNSNSNKKKTSNPLQKLPLPILAGLADLSLTVPKSMSDVDQLLKSFDSLKVGFEAKRKEALAGVEAKQAEIQAQIDALQAQL